MVKQCYRVNEKERKQLKDIMNYRKKFSAGVHTQEVTDLSDEVLAKRPVATYAKNHAVGLPRIRTT